MTLPTPAFPETTQNLTRDQFDRVAAIARKAAGLTISPTKLAMVQSRLTRRLSATGLPDFETYIRHVSEDGESGELTEMISVLTTNVSSFFREIHHFETLREKVLPPLIERARAKGRVRIWSAGCSSGQEPYSIAMTLLSLCPDAGNLDIRILASDIDRHILELAVRGTYPKDAFATVPAYINPGFVSPDPQDPTLLSMSQSCRELISIRQLNLLEAWPMRGDFDVIFCRNVLIYFDEETQAALWPRFQAQLATDGWLFLGHSERMHGFAGCDLAACGVTTYRRGAGQERT